MSSDFDSFIEYQILQALTVMRLNDDTRSVTLSKAAEIYSRKHPEATISRIRSVIEASELLELRGDEIVLCSFLNDTVSNMR